MFIENLKNTLNDEFNVSITENGAVGYRTSGKNLLDLNFAVSSLRSKSEKEIIDMFMKAFYDDKLMAMRWLFYASDVRQGLGERRLFRVIIRHLSIYHSDIVENLIDLIPEYSRWDNILEILDTPLEEKVISIIKAQLEEDCEKVGYNVPWKSGRK